MACAELAKAAQGTAAGPEALDPGLLEIMPGPAAPSPDPKASAV